jgi:hypothetical protein
MVEAAWVAVAHNTFWKAKFARYERRLGAGKAIVAIARQMLVSVWYLWHNRTVDRHSELWPSPTSCGPGPSKAAKRCGMA